MMSIVNQTKHVFLLFFSVFVVKTKHIIIDLRDLRYILFLNKIVNVKFKHVIDLCMAKAVGPCSETAWLQSNVTTSMEQV